MITCNSCGTENLDGSQYCDECGSYLFGTGYLSYSVIDVLAKDESRQGGGTDDLTKSAVPKQSQPRPNVQEKIASSIPAQNGMHAVLVIERGRSAGKRFPLYNDEAQIGRWDADSGIFPDVDLDADDPEAKVSRRHARIIRRSGQYLIEDLGSTNGTFINRGRRLLPGDKQPLRDGDEIIVGKTFLRFHIVN
jgi:hypothetical protein